MHYRLNCAVVIRAASVYAALTSVCCHFKRVNRNKRIRSRALHTSLQNPRSPVNRLPKPFSTLTYKTLDKLNSAVETRVPLGSTVKEQLKRDFTPEVETLSDLLGRDLRGWLK